MTPNAGIDDDYPIAWFWIHQNHGHLPESAA